MIPSAPANSARTAAAIGSGSVPCLACRIVAIWSMFTDNFGTQIFLLKRFRLSWIKFYHLSTKISRRFIPEVFNILQTARVSALPEREHTAFTLMKNDKVSPSSSVTGEQGSTMTMFLG
jgi:hypothetical protein